MKTASGLTVAALLAAGGIVTMTAPANAAFTTTCVGSGGEVTVPGDLVVPAGQACDLSGTTVDGNVRVAKGADLVAEGATVTGNVVVAEDGYLGLVDATVAGRVVSNSAFGVTLETSTVNGNYVGRAVEGSDVQSALYVEDDSRIGGRVDVSTGEVLVSGSWVDGSLTTDGARYTDIIDSVLLGSLSVMDNVEGAVFCDSEVDGDAVYTGNQYVLQIGADGPVEVCEGASVWGGDVTISDNAGDIRVSNNIIRGDLAGTGNDPAPRGSDNRVRGDISGQFEELAPVEDDAPLQAPSQAATATMKSLMKAQAVSAPHATVPAPQAVTARSENVAKRLGARTAAAEAEAKAAGPADLVG